MLNLRLFLLVAIVAVGYLLWTQWQIDYAVPSSPLATDDALPAPTRIAADAPPIPSDIPIAPSMASTDGAPTSAVIDEPQAPSVRVRTDVLDLEISLRGGAFVTTRLLDYRIAVKQPDPVVLFSSAPDVYFVAESGLVSRTHQVPDHKQLFETLATDYRLAEGQDELVVPLQWVGTDGMRVTKNYHFRRSSYAVQVRYQIANESMAAWLGSPYWQLVRTPPPASDSFSSPERFSFHGAALYTTTEKYEKFDFDDLREQTETREQLSGWAAMVQHYFLAAWLTPSEELNTLSAQNLSQSGRFRTRSVGPAIELAPGANRELSAILWIGPKLQDQLGELQEGLELTVDYGIFTPFSKILFWLLDKIHVFVGNWGVAIILLTILVKLAFFKLTEAQYKSMARMRKLQPRIQQLKERHGDDKQKFNLAMMEIYKKEKVNPLGGCLPMLIQIPVFIALYWVLVESVELRQAPFMLWIQDLSSPDPYFILPLINGAAMFMTTKLSPNPAADPIQQRIMLALPVVFSVMFAFFQAGLVLYWAVNSVLSLGQQWVITRRIEAA